MRVGGRIYFRQRRQQLASSEMLASSEAMPSSEQSMRGEGTAHSTSARATYPSVRSALLPMLSRISLRDGWQEMQTSPRGGRMDRHWRLVRPLRGLLLRS